MAEPAFSKQLLAWWDKHGRKDLPWQHPRTPYRVWVSEIMLQQTQVKTVIPYFERFMKRFPDIESLAGASSDDVLGHWSGLGYYARARNLQKAAKVCVDQHGGELPVDPVELLALPGIGESTANAIYSQAHDIPAVILDGNVKRVLSRYFAVEGWPGKTAIHRHLWKQAEALLPADRGADYSQAVMDLGATLCTRSRPDCSRCPVQADCKAYQSNTVERFPGKRPRIKVTKQTFNMLILTDNSGQVLLERRPPAGIWGGLWSLPTDETTSFRQQFGIESEQMKALPNLKHQLTHMQLAIQPLLCDLEPAAKGVECSTEQNWFNPQQWPELGLPKPVRELLETHLEHTKT